MCASKVRFYFRHEAITQKDNATGVESIQIFNQDDIFVFPREFQFLDNYKELCVLLVIKNGLKQSSYAKSIPESVRYITRWSLKVMYFDEEGKSYFKREYLDKMSELPQKSDSVLDVSVPSVSNEK